MMTIETLLDYLAPLTDLFGEHPQLRALALFIFTLLLANLVTLVLIRSLLRLSSFTKSHLDDQLIEAFKRPIFWSVIFIGTWASLILLTHDEKLLGIFKAIAHTLLIIIWSSFLIRLMNMLLVALSQRATTHSVVRPQTLPLFKNITLIVVLAGSVYFIFMAWNIDMTAWLASAGIAGIAIGFAAKDTLANLFSGVFILADSPYSVGDYVVLDSGERGKVTHIGIRSTRLLTRDDVEITIPNAIMGNTRIINESGGPYEKYRIRVKVGVAYGSDIDKVRSILQSIADEEVSVCELPEPRVRFRAFGNSSLDFELLCWVEQPELRGRVLDILNTAVYKRFAAEGVEIPYSKHDIYIKEMPDKPM